jgi:hypothetical protein
MQTTIVSCFLSNTNFRKDRNTKKYIEYGINLLVTDIPKIVFLDDNVINILINDYKYQQNEYTHIIIIKTEDLYLYNYKDKITKFNIITDFPDKDTMDYMLLICNKTEFIKRAIIINKFNTEHFIWVDFGINHIFKCSVENFHKKLENMANKEYDKIRIGSIVNTHCNKKNLDIYRKVCWVFAGGVFGGNKDYLLEFAELTKCKCLEIIEKKGTIMWEVNIWYLVFTDNKELFSPYYCDHNETLITNY